jgi:4-amino-4-deoxy-L-arabinose transferase-like glycosyltransferase
MSRLPPWILVIAVWAAIYLPALGSFEIKGEEGRRILPAIGMLDSGNYLVPVVGSDIYFSKPPLVNWLVAASFKVFGVRSEWTARLPSVLSILAVALTLVTVARATLGIKGATIAALIWLTIIGLIEKGRLIEIEAVYVSLCAIAILCWLSCWLGKRSPWLTWIAPWIWLGLGWLSKGPVHLIFFYAVVVAVLWQAKQLKALVQPAHFVGILIMLGIFAAWAIPFLELSGQSRGLTKWSGQFTGRANPYFFSLRATGSTLIRAIGQLLPWIIFVPWLRLARFARTEDQQLAKALAWGIAVPLVAVSLVPVSAARYSLPVAAPFCWLIALGFSRDGFVISTRMNWSGLTMWERLGQPVVVAVAVGALAFFAAIAHLPNKHEKVRNIAAEVNAIVPQSETVYVIDPGYQPFLFYVRAALKQVDRLEDVPRTANYFIVRGDREPDVMASEQWQPRHPVLRSRITDYRNETILLFKLEGS